MSNFSFSHSVVYLFRELSYVFIKFKIVVCNFFQLGSQTFVVWERVNNRSTWEILQTRKLDKFILLKNVMLNKIT